MKKNTLFEMHCVIETDDAHTTRCDTSYDTLKSREEKVVFISGFHFVFPCYYSSLTNETVFFSFRQYSIFLCFIAVVMGVFSPFVIAIVFVQLLLPLNKDEMQRFKCIFFGLIQFVFHRCIEQFGFKCRLDLSPNSLLMKNGFFLHLDLCHLFKFLILVRMIQPTWNQAIGNVVVLDVN